MKTSIILGGMFLIGGAATLASLAMQSTNAATESAAVPSSTPAAKQNVILSVPGMHCEFACAPKVRETLAAVPGVGGVETNVDEKTATITVKEGFQLDRAIAALDEAGYPAVLKSEE